MGPAGFFLGWREEGGAFLVAAFPKEEFADEEGFFRGLLVGFAEGAAGGFMAGRERGDGRLLNSGRPDGERAVKFWRGMGRKDHATSSVLGEIGGVFGFKDPSTETSFRGAEGR